MPKHRTYSYSGGCPVEATLDLIGGKWKGMLLYHLMSGTQRFNALKRNLPAITQRMLTKQLRELESAGVVNRVVYAEVPPRVEYSLSEMGRSLKPIISSLRKWGEDYLAERPQIRSAR